MKRMTWRFLLGLLAGRWDRWRQTRVQGRHRRPAKPHPVPDAALQVDAHREDNFGQLGPNAEVFRANTIPEWPRIERDEKRALIEALWDLPGAPWVRPCCRQEQAAGESSADYDDEMGGGTWW
jgi:hypothetical protein